MQTQVYPCTSLCTIHFHTNSETSLRFKTRRSRIKALAFSGISFVVSLNATTSLSRILCPISPSLKPLYDMTQTGTLSSILRSYMINSVSMIMQVDRSLTLRRPSQASNLRSLMKISNLLFARNVISSQLKGRPMQMQPSTMY